MKFKDIFCAIIGAIGGIVSAAFGGWNILLTILIVLNVLDYATGLAVAIVFRRSPKTDTGGANSAVGAKGICKKIFIWIIVLVASLIDRAIGLDYLRNVVVLFYIVNEVLSIIENGGLMGVPIPPILTKTIDVLHKKVTSEEPENCSIKEENNNG